jgi:MerR family transcriptional regulator/heat shock protein HspR
MTADPTPDRAVYGIAVVSELTGLHPQTLRGYEANDLVAPARTEGGTRRYSANDVAHVQRITALLAAGLNLAGVKRVLELEEETRRLRTELAKLRARTGVGRAKPRRRGAAEPESR